MSMYVKAFEDQTAFVARWTARLDARDSLVSSINGALPSGTLEVLIARTGGMDSLDNQIGNERALWQARIVGSGPKETVSVEDLRDLAAELGLPIPVDAQPRR